MSRQRAALPASDRCRATATPTGSGGCPSDDLELDEPDHNERDDPSTPAATAANPAGGDDRSQPATPPGRVVRSTYAFVRSALLSVAALVGVASAVVFAGSFALGMRPLIVASGSMEPTLPIGSVMFTKAVPASVPQPGDIVTVERPRTRGLVTHRLVSTQQVEPGVHRYVLQGDANTTADPEPYVVTTAGQYRFHIPRLGYLAHSFRTRSGQLVALTSALLLVALDILHPARFGRRRRTDPPVAPRHHRDRDRDRGEDAPADT